MCRITSVSEVEVKMWPCCSYSRRISPALIRLPLCPIATSPIEHDTSSGWMFDSLHEPVVE